MEAVLSKKTFVGLGYGSQADAFQCGREAAQMAKGEIPASSPDFALVLGSNQLTFNNFVEGARLVVGEKSLIGVCIPGVWTPSTDNLFHGAVLLFHSSRFLLSLGLTEIDSQNPLSSLTALFTQFRRARGNRRHQYDNHGVLVFGTHENPHLGPLASHIAGEAGIGSWMMNVIPWATDSVPLLCRNTFINNGLLALESLSHAPWGIGTIGMGAFKEERNIFKNATKSALSDALHQLKNSAAAAAFLFLNFSPDDLSGPQIKEINEAIAEVFENKPVICIPTQRQFVQSVNRSLTAERDSIAALVVPQ